MRTYTGSTSCDDRATRGNNKGKIMVNLRENVRDPEEIQRLNNQCIQYGKPPHYDLDKAQRNIVYESCLTTEEVFTYVFGEAMEDFNSRQKRSDRKTSLEKELAKLDKGKIKQELIHTMIIQVGNKDSRPDEDECVAILQEYLEEFRQRFPNMRIVNAAIHLDEDTPHLQIYFVPVKTREQHEAMQTVKKWSGMDVQPSLTGALEQMGYDNSATMMVPKKDENGGPVLDANGEPVMVEKHDYKQGAMAQWQKDFNGLLDEICLEHGIELDHYQRGQKVSHQDTLDYQEGKIQAAVQYAKETLETVELATEQERETLQAVQEEAERLKASNSTLQGQNEALRTNNKIIKDERDAAIKERNNAQEEVKNLKEKIEIMKNELMEWAGKLQNEIVAIFKKLNNTRKIANASPWLSEDTKIRIAQNADKIALRSEKTVNKPLSSTRDYANAYNKLESELAKAGDLEQVARRKKNIDEVEDGWEYDD